MVLLVALTEYAVTVAPLREAYVSAALLAFGPAYDPTLFPTPPHRSSALPAPTASSYADSIESAQAPAAASAAESAALLASRR